MLLTELYEHICYVIAVDDAIAVSIKNLKPISQCSDLRGLQL